MAKACVLLTVLLTVYGQLVVKWVVLRTGQFPLPWHDRLQYIGKLLLNPWVWSVFLAAFLASVSWMVAMTRLELSQAYPFTSLAFVLVAIFSFYLFQEPINATRLTGMLLIICGILLIGRS